MINDKEEQLEWERDWRFDNRGAMCTYCLKPMTIGFGVINAESPYDPVWYPCCAQCYQLAKWHAKHKWTVFWILSLIFPHVPREVWHLIEKFTYPVAW
jgi:hypothetical protein